jgi:hypothetical protein
VNPLALAALAVMKHRLGDVLDRNGHLATLLDVHDLPAGHRLRHRLPDLLAVSLDEALLVDGTLVAAVFAPIDDRSHKPSARLDKPQPPGRVDEGDRVRLLLRRFPDAQIPLHQ